MKTHKQMPFLIILLLWFFTINVNAQLIIYEGANYAIDASNPDPDGGLGVSENGLPATNVGGNPTGTSTGLRQSWGVDTKVVAGLNYSNNGQTLYTSGNALMSTLGTNSSTPTYVYRWMTTDPFSAYRTGNTFGTATAGKNVLYLSVLLNPSDVVTKKGLSISGNNFPVNGGIYIMQNANGHWAVCREEAPIIDLGAPTVGKTELVVLRLTFVDAANLNIEAWFNPNLGVALPTPTGSSNFALTTGTGNITAFQCRYGNSKLTVDEIRMGLTAADVMPIAMPTSTASVPTGLSNSTPTTTSFTLSWNASTGIGVSGYDVFRNGILYAATSTNSLLIEGLPSTAYTMTIKAKDAAGISSAASAPWTVTTAAIIPKDLIVSTTGNDLTGDGSLEKPFLTIQRASNLANFGDKIQIRTGTYREAVDIKADGITLEPYNGEKVTISGADLLTSWVLVAGNTYQTTMAWDLDTWGSNQLFADGKMIELARWPDQTSSDIVMPTNAFADKASSSKAGELILTDADFNEPDGRWVGAKIWINLSRNGWDGQGFTAYVTATSAANHTITVAFIDGLNNVPVLTNNPWGIGQNTEYYLFDPVKAGVEVTGGVNALLSNGEWWKDGSTLYVKTPNGNVPSATGIGANVIEAKKRHFGFYSSTTNNSYTIKGFDLFACAITTDLGVRAHEKSKESRGIKEEAHDIMIDGITAKYISHQTDFSGNFQSQHYAWTGIVLSGRNNTLQNSDIQYSATSALSITGKGNKVLNNTIANTNYGCSNSGAINNGYLSQDADIGYNTIYNTTIMAIYIPYAENSDINVPDAFRIHHNTIYNFMRRSGDSGAIDEVGKDLQWMRIDHNIIYNTTPVTGGMIHGIYIDFGGGPGVDLVHVTIDHNVVFDVPSPIFMNSARFVNIYNNVAMSLPAAGDYGIKFGNGASKGSDNKIYNNISSRGIGNLANADLRNNITNANSSVLNDLFVNPASRDYRLKPTAFAAIDQGVSVGIYDEVLIGGIPDVGAYEIGSYPDAITPSIPTGLNITSVLTNSFVLNWTESTDNLGGFITYDVYKNGVLLGNTNLTTFKVMGLESSTPYQITIKAKDTHNNTSDASATLNVSTISTSTLHVEAESKTVSSGGSLNAAGAWGNLKTGVYLQYDNVKMSGQNLFKANISSSKEGVQLEIRLNKPDGLLLGTLNVASTGAYTVYTEQTTELTGVPFELSTLVIIASNPNVSACYLDWFEFSDTQSPTTPTGLTSSAISATAFALNWTAATDNVGVSGYDAYNGATLIGSSVGAGSTMNITGLTANTAYNVTLIAKDESGHSSAPSEPLTLTTTAIVDATSPGLASGLAATKIDGTSFTLSWTAATDNIGIGGYDIYNGTTLLAATTGTATTFDLSGLTGLTTYNITLVTRDVVGNKSVSSAALQVLTLDNVAPTVPTGMTVSSVIATSFTVSWAPSSDNVAVTGYEVYSDGNLIANTINPTYSFTGLPSATTFIITIKAKDARGNISASSANFSVTTFDNAASSIHIEAESYSFKSGGYVAAGAISGLNTDGYLQFDNVSFSGQTTFKANIARPGVSGQNLEIRLDALDGTLIGVLTVAATSSWDTFTAQSTTLTTAPSGVHSLFIIARLATYGVGNLDWFEFSDRPGTPTALVATNQTLTGFTLSWTAPSDLSIAGYDIYNNGTLVGSTTTATTFDLTGLTIDTPYLMTVFAINAAGNTSAASKAMSITLNDNTGFEQNTEMRWKLYSHSGQIIADFSDLIGSKTVQVFNASGIMVTMLKTSDNQLTISVPNKGFYFVRVIYDGRQLTKKIMLF